MTPYWHVDVFRTGPSTCEILARLDKIRPKLKMADFLLCLGNGSKRLFCKSESDAHAYQISCMSVKAAAL